MIEIPGYAIERKLAQGGMAEVYLAEQRSLRRKVVVKIMRTVGDEAAQRFLNEGRIVASLSHPNIVTVHDIGTVGDEYFLAMEYVPGGDLRDRMGQPPMPPAKALAVVKVVADALGYAHHHGVVHRDVKPANILFRADDTPMITDFGIAKAVNDDGLTKPGSVLGSPHYISPDLAFGQTLDGRADIYSLGIVLFQLLTGRLPFDGSSDMAAIYMNVNEPLPSLPDALSAYQGLIDRMTAKRPSDRFDSMGDVVAAIDALGSKPLDASTVAIPSATPRGPRAALAIGALALMALGVGGWRLMERHESPDVALAPPARPADITVSGVNSAPTPARSTPSVAPSPSLPAPTPPTPAEIAEQRIVEATDAINAGRLLPPDRDNAFEALSAAQTIVGDGKSVSFAPLVNALIDEIDGVLATGKPGAALALIDRAQRYFPDDQAISNRHAVAARRVRVEQLVASGRRAIENWQLTSPPRKNAVYYFREALRINPEHRGAQTGLHDVGDQYARMAQSQLAKYRYDKAREYIRRGLTITPNHSRLLALREEARLVNAPRRLVRDVKRLLN